MLGFLLALITFIVVLIGGMGALNQAVADKTEDAIQKRLKQKKLIEERRKKRQKENEKMLEELRKSYAM